MMAASIVWCHHKNLTSLRLFEMKMCQDFETLVSQRYSDGQREP